MDIDSLRQLFPQLQDKVYGKTLVYLDNAATSLRPSCVVDCWRNSAEHYTANLHRAVHHIADLATRSYEEARSKVASYIGARSASEIVFTSGATASRTKGIAAMQPFNLAAFSSPTATNGTRQRTYSSARVWRNSGLFNCSVSHADSSGKPRPGLLARLGRYPDSLASSLKS